MRPTADLGSSASIVPAAGVIRRVEAMHRGAVEVAVTMQPGQATPTDLTLHSLEIGRVQLYGRGELGAIGAGTHFIGLPRSRQGYAILDHTGELQRVKHEVGLTLPS